MIDEKHFGIFIGTLFDKILELLPDLIAAVIIAVVGFFVIKLIAKISRKAMHKANIDFSLEKFFIKCIKTAGYIILVMSILSQLGISTTGIIAFFSAGVAAVALALKDSLANIAGGIVLLFSRPFVTGDIIEFAGERGTIKQIDILHTKIITLDNRGLMIPNSILSSVEVVNCTIMDKRRVDITVPVGYDCNLDEVKRVILSTVMENKMVLSQPEPPFIKVNKFSESSVDIALRVWVETENYWDVYHDLMEKILDNFQKNGIIIPFNQLDVHMVK